MSSRPGDARLVVGALLGSPSKLRHRLSHSVLTTLSGCRLASHTTHTRGCMRNRLRWRAVTCHTAAAYVIWGKQGCSVPCTHRSTWALCRTTHAIIRNSMSFLCHADMQHWVQTRLCSATRCPKKVMLPMMRKMMPGNERNLISHPSCLPSDRLPWGRLPWSASACTPPSPLRSRRWSSRLSFSSD